MMRDLPKVIGVTPVVITIRVASDRVMFSSRLIEEMLYSFSIACVALIYLEPPPLACCLKSSSYNGRRVSTYVATQIESLSICALSSAEPTPPVRSLLGPGVVDRLCV